MRILNPSLDERVNRIRIDKRDDDVARASLYNIILTVNPFFRNVHALCDYGDLLIDRGDNAEALAIYHRVLVIDPNCYSAVLRIQFWIDSKHSMIYGPSFLETQLQHENTLLQKKKKKKKEFYDKTRSWSLRKRDFEKTRL